MRPHLEYASHSILAEKYQHTREGPEICPQNQLFDIAEHCLNADSTLTSAPCSELYTDYLLCFIDPSPALTTSITPFVPRTVLYGTHYQFYLCLIVKYHILDHMYGCILHISSAIFIYPLLFGINFHRKESENKLN